MNVDNDLKVNPIYHIHDKPKEQESEEFKQKQFAKCQKSLKKDHEIGQKIDIYA